MAGRFRIKPITFCCTQTLSRRPDEIADNILDLASWPGFQGYGVLPGVKLAEFEVRTPVIVGTLAHGLEATFVYMCIMATLLVYWFCTRPDY